MTKRDIDYIYNELKMYELSFQRKNLACFFLTRTITRTITTPTTSVIPTRINYYFSLSLFLSFEYFMKVLSFLRPYVLIIKIISSIIQYSVQFIVSP